MGSDWGQWQQLQRKSKQFLVKFLGLALLVGLSFRLLFSGSPVFPRASELPSESIAEKSDATTGVSEEAYKGEGFSVAEICSARVGFRLNSQVGNI